MLAAYAFVRALHIIGGAVGLVSMFVPLLARKGGRLHRRVGKVFAVAMTTAGISGVVMAAAWLLVPARLGEGDPASLRVRGLFFGAIGMLLLCAVQQMLRSLARKHSPGPQPSALDLGLPIASLVVGLAAVVAGLAWRRPLPIGFGALAVASAIGDLRFVLRPLSSPRAWWYQHMRGVMGAMLSAITAFAVFGGRRLFAEVVPAELWWLPWFGPTLVVVPLFMVWIARWRRRFGEAGHGRRRAA